MNFTIGSIKWPGSASDALSKYLGFLILSVEKLDIDFPDSEVNPILLAKRYVQGLDTQEQLNSAADYWWGKIDSGGGLRDLESHDVLMARIALCFLSIRSSDQEFLNESLSWYLQVLDKLGLDVDLAIDLMESYFKDF